MKFNDNSVHSTDMYKPIDYEIIIPNSTMNDCSDFYVYEKINIHPNILLPYSIKRGINQTTLLYKVNKNGMTLREFINVINKTHNTLRSTLRNTLRSTLRNTNIMQYKRVIKPLEIILQLISAYEHMLSNNMVLPSFSINPDYVWIQYDESGKQHVLVINAFENILIDKCDYCANSDKNYWSPETLGKYRHTVYYDENNQSNSEKINEFKINSKSKTKKSSSIVSREYSRNSTIGSVYSLGLILYFMTFHKDPFDEHRLHEDDTPDFAGCNENNDLIKIIKFATITDVVERPTLLEFKEFIIHTMVSKYNRYFSCFHF